MLDGGSILRSGRRSGLLTDMRAIETDKGTAVAFHLSGSPAHDRKAYSGIVGDSGVAIAFEHEPHTRESARREIVSLDSERLLLVEGNVQRRLSMLTCAQSLPTAGLACETPEELRLRSRRGDQQVDRTRRPRRGDSGVEDAYPSFVTAEANQQAGRHHVDHRPPDPRDRRWVEREP